MLRAFGNNLILVVLRSGGSSEYILDWENTYNTGCGSVGLAGNGSSEESIYESSRSCSTYGRYFNMGHGGKFIGGRSSQRL